MQTEKRKTFLINLSYFGVIAALSFVSIQYILPLIAPFAAAFFIA